VLTGFLSGILLSLYLYRRRKKIVDRLNEIEKRLKGIEVRNSIKNILWETTSNIKKIITSTKNVPVEEKEYILKKVEEKIRKLEEIV